LKYQNWIHYYLGQKTCQLNVINHAADEAALFYWQADDLTFTDSVKRNLQNS